MPTLKASRLGIAKIKQARNEKGWSWSTCEDACLVEASKVLAPSKSWFTGGPYAPGISEGTWKRFLAGRQAISAAAFKAYCEVLGLNWDDVVDRRSSKIANPRQDWGEAIDISVFYGRSAELGQLEQWIINDQCRLVALLGIGGIGKTALAVKLAEQVQHSFEYLIWRSLHKAPPVLELLAELIEFLSQGQETNIPKTVDDGISHLIDYLRSNRCLLLLDDVETILSSGELAGRYRDGYEGYGELMQRVGEERHQSCLTIISREQPREVALLAGAALPVRDLRLKGLPQEDAKKILEAKGVSRLSSGWEELIQIYRGNPLALKITATTIQEIFNGDISQFLAQSTLVIGDIIHNVLDQQFERLSTLEKDVIYWLAIENQPVLLGELRADLQFSVSSSTQLLAALESLKRRSLIEKEQSLEELEGNEAIFTLQPVIMKYVTHQLIEQVCRDILAVIETDSIEHLGLLRRLSLVKEEEDDDDLKAIQVRLILKRVIDRLNRMVSSTDSLEQQFNTVLLKLQGKSQQAIGYAQTNILNLKQAC